MSSLMRAPNAAPLGLRQFGCVQRSPASQKRTLRPVFVAAAASKSGTKFITETGIASQQGTSRKQNEDRFSVDVEATDTPVPYAAVFDGHGGNACSDWLSNNFSAYLDIYWESGAAPVAAITQAFLAADKRVLQPKKGFLGSMGERGIGGSKCGATGAVSLIYSDAKTGKPMLLTANAGDARVVLGRKSGETVQLTIDHVPDSEEERLRIEKQNPNPRQPLVRYVGGTWRVGGLLALSRAFGNAYLKGTGQFEGIQAGSDGYSSGFGVVAEPDVAVTELTEEDAWVVISSDGLFANEERGGGGGLTNEEVIKMCNKMAGKSCNEIAQTLATAAVEAGTTDDITLVVLKLAV